MSFVDLEIIEQETINLDLGGVIYNGGSGGGGTSDYNSLRNKPSINGVTLQGDKTDAELGITTALMDDINVTNTVGGAKTGMKYDAGERIETIIRNMLNPVMNPQLTNPSATLSYDVPSLVAVGDMIGSKTATVGLNRGSINPQYTADEKYRSGAATGYALKVHGSTITFEEDNTTGLFNVPSFTKNTKGNVTITATASYGEGCQPKNSVGEDFDSPYPSGSKSTTKTIEFIIPFFYGAVSDKSSIDIESLTKDVSKKGQKKYSYTTNDEFMVIAYDSSYGDLTLIQDGNGFDGTTGFEKMVIGDYYVYVAKSATIDTDALYTFSF